jgi:molybdopterin-guanine dinucleotide biosynthesis protein MobB
MKTRRPPVISVVGSKNSGKTRVIEILTNELTKRGYKVAAVKHIPKKDFTIDTEGKDTWRFANAGAKTIVAVSPVEIATVEKGDTRGLTLKDLAKRCRESDLIIVEGFRELLGGNLEVPKIVAVKNVDEALEALKTFKPIMALAGLGPLNEVPLGFPYINVLENGGKLADLVEEFVGKKGKIGA